MSSISSIGGSSAPYQPIKPTATQSKPATATPAPKNDPDNDGDTHAGGVDTKG
jgi:hypothetical protein